MKKPVLITLTLFCLLAAVMGFSVQPTGVPEWSIERKASKVRVDATGQIRVEPRSGKGTTFGSGTVNFTGSTVSGLNGSAIDAGTVSATRLPTAMNSMTFATAKTVALTDADSLTVGGVIVPQHISINFGALSATSASGDAVFTANRAYQVTAIRLVQRAQGGSGCVADVEKLTGTTAPGSGTVLGTASYNCNSTANSTVTAYSLTATVGTLQLAAGDRLGVKLGGTLTSLAGLNITVQLKAI